MKLSTIHNEMNQEIQNIYNITGEELTKTRLNQIRSPFSSQGLRNFINFTGRQKIVITGSRRSGKTFLLNQLVKYMFSIEQMKINTKVLYACPTKTSISLHRDCMLKELAMFNKPKSYTSNMIRLYNNSMIYFTLHDAREYCGMGNADCLVIDDATWTMDANILASMLICLNKGARVAMVCDRNSGAMDLARHFNFQEVNIYGY